MNRTANTFLRSLLLCLLWCACARNLVAAEVTLTWDPNPEGDNVIGYRLYFGTSWPLTPVNATIVDVGNVTTHTLRIYNPGTYFFAVTAYNEYGESGFSNEVQQSIDGACTFFLSAESQFLGEETAFGRISVTDPARCNWDAITVTAGLPFELIENGGRRLEGGSAVSGLNRTAKAAAAGSQALYSPRYIAGGNRQSDLYIFNLDDSFDAVTLRFYSESGVLIGFRQFPIDAHGKLVLADKNLFADAGPEPIDGYVLINSERNSRLWGSMDELLLLPVPEPGKQVFGRIAFDDMDRAAIEMLNLWPTEILVTLEVYGEEGMLEASAPMTIPAWNRWAGPLTELIPGLHGMSSGYVRLVSTGALAARLRPRP